MFSKPGVTIESPALRAYFQPYLKVSGDAPAPAVTVDSFDGLEALNVLDM